mmetsp:Transcript_33395/g.88327  ORF Transcript_33395/g.88327 Transcript_33395/m.88327 type:complete len:233 (+) Transcript_33395:174-872(+)
MKLWERAAMGDPSSWGAKGELVEALEPWDSGVDFPFSSFPAEMVDQYPDAKFILTVREAGKWADSINKTICTFQSGPKQTWFMALLNTLPFGPFPRFVEQYPMMDAIMAAKFRGVSSWSEMCASREKAMRAYDEWNTYVKTVVPAKKLLVFNPKEGHGYKELATFLGVDEPAEPFPHVNSTSEFEIIKTGLMFAAIVIFFLVPAFLLYMLARVARGVVAPSGSRKSDAKKAR